MTAKILERSHRSEFPGINNKMQNKPNKQKTQEQNKNKHAQSLRTNKLRDFMKTQSTNKQTKSN